MSDTDVEKISETIKNQSATFLTTTSSNFVKLVESKADLSTLRTIVVCDNDVTLSDEIKSKVSAKVKQVGNAFLAG